MSNKRKTPPALDFPECKREMVDVAADGSCYFRALFQAAHYHGLLPAVTCCLTSKSVPVERAPAYGDRPSKEERAWVAAVRKSLAERVRQGKDYGMVQNLYDFLKIGYDSVVEDARAAKARPPTFQTFFKQSGYNETLAAEYAKVPLDRGIATFREFVAKQLENTNVFVGDVETKLVQQILNECLADGAPEIYFVRLQTKAPVGPGKNKFQAEHHRTKALPADPGNEIVLVNVDSLHFQWLKCARKRVSRSRSRSRSKSPSPSRSRSRSRSRSGSRSKSGSSSPSERSTPPPLLEASPSPVERNIPTPRLPSRPPTSSPQIPTTKLPSPTKSRSSSPYPPTPRVSSPKITVRMPTPQRVPSPRPKTRSPSPAPTATKQQPHKAPQKRLPSPGSAATTQQAPQKRPPSPGQAAHKKRRILKDERVVAKGTKHKNKSPPTKEVVPQHAGALPPGCEERGDRIASRQNLGHGWWLYKIKRQSDPTKLDAMWCHGKEAYDRKGKIPEAARKLLGL